MAENNCVVCFKNCRIYSIGECDHPVCYECSTRMRVLCRQNECPMCRHEMEMVVFTEKVQPFRRLKRAYVMYDPQHYIAFESSYVRDYYDHLLEYVCKKCLRRPTFESFDAVNDHMRREHNLYCCNLCADNLKIFPAERRYYTEQELKRHKRIGDIDDRSHRGHPLCEFCDVRYVDRDELYRHLRKEHLFCHICDSEGFQQFYGMYDMLRDHYRKEHFLCEEGDCYLEQLTSVFPTEIDLKAHKALVHRKGFRNKQAAKQARTLELEFTLAPRSQSERHRGRPYHQDGDESTSSQSAQSQEPTQDIVASWDHDFPSLTNSGTPITSRPKIIQNTTSKGWALNDRNFPALGSETSIKLNVTNSVDSYPSTSAPITSTNISVQVNRNKPKVTNRTRPQLNDVPSSMLSLTWVKKAKEKKPPPEPVSPLDVPVKPPTLNGKNFPTLNKNTGGESTEPTKHNKKSTLSVQIDENDNQRVRVNYSEAMATKSISVPSDAKTGRKKPGSSKAKEKTEICFQSSNKDNKTHCFLLNTSRKKVKMKPETFTTLNESASSQSSLPKSSTSSVAKERKEQKIAPDTAKSNRSDFIVAKSSDVSCDTGNTNEKIKNSDKKVYVKEKRENIAQRKDKEKLDDQQKNKENEQSSTKSDRVQKEKKSVKFETNTTNILKSNDNGGGKMETSEKQKTDRKVRRLKKSELGVQQMSEPDVEINLSRNSGRKTETGEKQKTDKKSQLLKKSELSVQQMSKPNFKINPSGSSASSSVTSKPPPGLDKPAPSSAPPGFVPLQNGFSSHANKSGTSSLSGSVSDTLFVYQQPEGFVSRNSQLIEKINDSLDHPNEEALNEFKNISLLFREGYISASNYYMYCMKNIKSEKFEDVFIDLVALLPNILKQQELWSVHESMMPSNIQSALLVGSCSICFQILKLDDAMLHYSKHGLTVDDVMQCVGVTK